MRKLLTEYVINFNRRHGHLFQNRYNSIVCQEDGYIKELVRYIQADQRVLGDSDFFQEVLSDLDKVIKKSLKLSGQRRDIAALAEDVCKKI